MDIRSPNLISTADDLISPFEPSSAEDDAFAAYYEKEIRPLMTALEVYRSDALAEAARRKPWAILIAILGIVGGILLAFALNKGGLPFIGAIVICTAALAWAQSPLRWFEMRRQNEIMPKVVRFFGDFSYLRHGDVTESEVLASKIVPLGNQFTTGDQVTGTHKDTSIRFVEIRTVKRRRKSSTVLFSGLFVTIEFNKPFHGITLVKKEAGQARMMGEAGDLETVDLEDPVFEGKFEVYSNDQVEARYLLTPDLMVRLLDLVDARGGKSFQCAFAARRLNIAIPTSKNMFELADAKRHSDDLPGIREVYREVKDVIAIIDILKINNGRRA